MLASLAELLIQIVDVSDLPTLFRTLLKFLDQINIDSTTFLFRKQVCVK